MQADLGLRQKQPVFAGFHSRPGPGKKRLRLSTSWRPETLRASLLSNTTYACHRACRLSGAEGVATKAVLDTSNLAYPYNDADGKRQKV